jgi:hypothetical protein
MHFRFAVNCLLQMLGLTSSYLCFQTIQTNINLEPVSLRALINSSSIR